MFVPKSVFNDLNVRAISAEAKRSQLEVHVASLTSHIEWLQVRLTQLEFERAQLLQRYMGVTVPVPTFEKAPVLDASDLSNTPDFNDIGDEEAQRLGIGWNADGTLRFVKK